MWQHEGLVMPKRVRDASLAYREASDVLGEWVQERCGLEDAAETDSIDLYTSYRLWAESCGHRPFVKRTFTVRLTDRGLKLRKSNGRTIFTGIRLRATGRHA